MDCPRNFELNTCPDGTVYEFTKRQEPTPVGEKTVWYVLAHKCFSDGSTVVYEYPYNKGKFGDNDYSLSPGCPAFWDWFKGVSTTERQSFRNHWMWHMKPQRPMSIEEYRNAISARTNTVAHNEPEVFNLFNTFMTEAKPSEIMSSWLTDYQQGNNPMRDFYATAPCAAPKSSMTTTATTINLMPAANATVSAQTDTQQQRGYLMERLDDTTRHYSPKYEAVRSAARELYNIGIDNTPKNLEDLMARLAAKDFTIDADKAALQKKYDGSWTDDDEEYIPDGRNYFYALKWNGPAEDRKGYEAQMDAFKAEIAKAKDAIMIEDPKVGLTALQTLEAWQPTGKAN